MTDLQHHKPIIAIDGPAGSGKSTTAKLLARRLGFTYLDTGAYYRAVTLQVLESQTSLDDYDGVLAQAARCRIEILPAPPGDRVLLNGRDVSSEIRQPEISNAIGPIASHPGVRKILAQQQREFGLRGGVVMEGRDIGTVVLPEADLKIFLVASLDERTRRRQSELAAKGIARDYDLLRQEIAERDQRDSQRQVSPLKRAPDAVDVDTTNLTIEEQVEAIILALHEKSSLLRQ